MQRLDLHVGPVLKIMGNEDLGKALETGGEAIGKTGILGREKGRDLEAGPAAVSTFK